jgi:2-desacetyl-2-hydroxyethyl bacteriochlorophyllide A dehydrogenase
MRMKALFKPAKTSGKLEVREVDEPEATEDQVVVEVKAAGICGSDVKHLLRVRETPVILGHECSGEIVEVGSRVEGWSVGDRVVTETSGHVCGRCYYCMTGDYHLCRERRGLGSGMDGVFTRFIALPPRLLHAIPDGLSYDEAALVQPCADIANAVIRKADVCPGDTVVVLGPGPMGLLTTQIAKARGASTVVQTGHRGVRLGIAGKIGADVTIPVEEEDPVERVMGLTGGLGADVVFEASGAGSAALQAFEIVRRKGQVTFIASPPSPVDFGFRGILGKALTVRGSIMSKWIDYERAIGMMSTGAVRAAPIITHRFPITEWREAFDAIMVEKTAGKVLLTPV